MKELWAIKSPDGEIEAYFESERNAWWFASQHLENITPELNRRIEFLKLEGHKAVRVRVEEIEENESDDSKEKGGE